MIVILYWLLLASSIGLPVLACWRMIKLDGAKPLRKYQTVLLGAIALRNVLRVWARDDVQQIVYSHAIRFWAKTIAGQVIECVALAMLCLFLLGLLNGIEIRPATVPPKSE